MKRSLIWRVALLWFASSIAMLAADKSHVVQRGDTLSGIARRNGVSPSALARRNQLSPAALVRTGQRLVLPDKVSSATPPSLKLDPTVQRVLTAAKVRKARWRHIVIHHSGSDAGTVVGMDRYHREERHMENGLAYHFVIGNGQGMADGAVAVGPRWTKQLDGGHLASETQNKVSLGICLVGNFDTDRPSAKQLDSLGTLIQALLKRCALTTAAVKTHQQINVVHTRCPGENFPTEFLLRALK